MFTAKIHHVKVASATVYGNTCKKILRIILLCKAWKKNTVSKIKHCDDWFEPSQCFVLTIAMNGLNHHCVFLPHSEYAVEGVLRDFSYSKNGTINTRMLYEAIGVSTRTILYLIDTNNWLWLWFKFTNQETEVYLQACRLWSQDDKPLTLCEDGNPNSHRW